MKKKDGEETEEDKQRAFREMMMHVGEMCKDIKEDSDEMEKKACGLYKTCKDDRVKEDCEELTKMYKEYKDDHKDDKDEEFKKYMEGECNKDVIKETMKGMCMAYKGCQEEKEDDCKTFKGYLHMVEAS